MIKAELVSLWNDESTALDNARVSVTGKVVEQGVLSLKDIRLLRELMFFEHHVPFESITMRWKIDAPIFVVRQLVKHRLSSISEKSKRYRGDVANCYVPDGEALWVDDFRIFTEEERNIYIQALNDINHTREFLLNSIYERIEDARSKGELPPDPKTGRDPWRARARELVRGLQTVSEETNLYFTLNFRSMMNFLWLRSSEHAQWEIRELAQQMDAALRAELPLLMEVLDEYYVGRQAMYDTLEGMM